MTVAWAGSEQTRDDDWSQGSLRVPASMCPSHNRETSVSISIAACRMNLYIVCI